MKLLKNLFLFLFPALFCTTGTFAQTRINAGDNVDIERQFNARVADAERMRLNPTLPQPDSTRGKVSYSISNKALNVQYLPPKVTPRSLKNEPRDTVYGGYLQLGGGVPQALLLEGGYDVLKNKNLNAGFNLRHYAINNSKNVENQQSASSDFGAHATIHTDMGFSVGGKLNYSQDIVHFYGYNERGDTSAPSFAASDVRQRFSMLSGQAQIFNNQKTVGNIDYTASLDFYRLEDLFAARESGLNLVIDGKKWYKESNALGIRLQADLSAYRDTAKQTLNNFFLAPTYSFHGSNYRATIGVNVAAQGSEFFIYPLLEGSFNVAENFLTAFAGIEGGLQKNNFRNLTTYNPFLDSRQQLRNSMFTHYYGGIKGDYQGINYRAQVGYKNVDNLALFLVNNDSVPRFEVLYDSAGIFTLSLELSTKILEGLEINGRFSQHIFNLQTQEKPWHLPTLSVNAGLSYKGLVKGLTLRGEVFFQNALPVKASDGTPDNLNTLLDLNASADYHFSKNLGAFVQINNMLNNRYQRWQYYPMIGLNAVAGIRARF